MNTGAFGFLRLVTLLCTLIAVRAHGQEEVIQFCNACLPSPPDRLVRDVNGNPLVGTNYLVQLYYGSTPDTLVAFAGLPGRFRPALTTLPGTWTAPSGTRSIFPPIPATIFLQVRVWDITAGMTYEEASQNTTGRQYGKSAAFIYEPCGNPPRSADCQKMLGFRGFTLVTNAPPNPVNPPDRVVVIRESGSGVDVVYSGTHTIEAAPTLRGPWTTIYSGTGPYTDANPNPVRFYRMRDEPGPTYSLNAVGYYRLSLCNGYSLIANQLNAAGGNAVTNLFKSPPEGTRVYKFNRATGGFIVAQFLDGEWEGAGLEMTLNPGEGMYIGSSLTSHRFLGDVPMGNLQVPLPAGFSLISNPLPEGGPVSLVTPDGLGLPIRNGSMIFQWTCAGSGQPPHFIFNQYFDGEWDGGVTPTVSIGEAFYFFNPGAALSWNRNFTIAP